MQEEVIFRLETGTPVWLTIHTPSEAVDRHMAILYFHGGGLFYGQRDDLPAPYIDTFLREGCTLVCADYPLAPEARLAEITAAAAEIHDFFYREFCLPRGISRYFLFGRSSGGYLALWLARELLARPAAEQPAGILDFYGYYDLNAPFFSAPSAFYRQLPAVPEALVQRCLGQSPITSGTREQRFSLYVHARQTGQWLALLGPEAGGPRFSLSEADLHRLPPLFIAASTGDRDVPYRVSKNLARLAPAARLHTVYYLEHDFDRDSSIPAGQQTYEDCLAWMHGLTE